MGKRRVAGEVFQRGEGPAVARGDDAGGPVVDHFNVVIPGCAEGASPESILPAVVMDSGLVAIATPRNDDVEDTPE